MFSSKANSNYRMTEYKLLIFIKIYNKTSIGCTSYEFSDQI